MPKPRNIDGGKNIVGPMIKALRKRDQLSQRDLAYKLQLMGFDMDKNVITRIETNKRFVTDIEIRALAKLFDVPYALLIDGNPEEIA